MHVALVIVFLALTAVAVTAVAGRTRVPVPLVMVAVGIAGSYVPRVPDIELTPEMVLVGFLPPLLYAAAQRSSLVDFNVNRRSILLLSVGLVVFTTLGVGLVVHTVLPEVGWAASFAIGAVVAPPDAVAAIAIAKRIGLPRRVVTVLEGESLLNDATALVALRTAITGSASALVIATDFAIAAAGGVAVGLLFYAVLSRLRPRMTDPLLDSALGFIVPFAAYVAAEELHASGVLAVVVSGLLLGHRAPVLQSATSRITEASNWRTISFILESSIFLLIGLQARRIVVAVDGNGLGAGRVVAVCASALAAVIVLRIVWVMGSRSVVVRPDKHTGVRQRPSWSSLALASWAGMRGAVTLAAAFVIPPDTPYREVLLLVAFTVTIGTLFLQGLTLPLLARLLRVQGPDPGEDALARATLLEQASQLGLAVLDEEDSDDPHGVHDAARRRVRQRSYAAWERLGDASVDGETPSEAYTRLRSRMLAREREHVLEVRSSGAVPHAVIEEVLAQLDLEESLLEQVGRVQQQSGIRAVRRTTNTTCAHLDAVDPTVREQTPGECHDCLEEGLTWVHLRGCMTCGHVGCCDSSVGQHATRHFESTGHPVMRSAESGDDWRWCFVDQVAD